MKPFIAMIVALATLTVAPDALGQGRILESYIARLGPADHFNSYGERLTTAAAVIRQDRANFHVYGQRDSEDEGDRFFASRENRARMEALLAAGRAGPGVRRAIVNGRPLIRVDVYRNAVNVTLL